MTEQFPGRPDMPIYSPNEVRIQRLKMMPEAAAELEDLESGTRRIARSAMDEMVDLVEVHGSAAVVRVVAAAPIPPERQRRDLPRAPIKRRQGSDRSTVRQPHRQRRVIPLKKK